jgi:plasmid stabilization system protein ParE
VTGYRITKQAARDLKEIWHYTANNHSESQADRYVAMLKTGCTKITENPTMRRILKLAGSQGKRKKKSSLMCWRGKRSSSLE